MRHFRLLLLGVFLLCGYAQAQDSIGISLPKPPRTVDLFEEEFFGLEQYAVDSTFFAKRPGFYKREVTLDSAGTRISIRETIDDTDMYFPAVVDLESYIEKRVAYNWRQLTRKKFIDHIAQQREEEFGAIELDIPFRIKSETFTRIFGSDRISLRVTGNISFDLSGRTEERSGSAINARENQNTFSPRFSQTQQFTVEGKIGEKVTVSVQQNSEAVTDIENTLKLRYDGEEDEIVEKIEAGNISLSLPSTKYVIFGGSNKGLFGLKANLRLGDLYMTTIASLEKGEQQELSITGASSESKTTVKDYEFIKNRYFFLDRFYYDNFQDGFTENLQVFNYPQGSDIIRLEVWVSTNPNGEPGARRGIAAVDPAAYEDADYNSLEPEDGKVDKGWFRQLEEGRDYEYDQYRGFFWLNQSVDNNTLLAIAYAVSGAPNDPVGTLTEQIAQDDSAIVVLKMIKPKQQLPSETYAETWPLMMKNVYSLGGTNIEQEGFDIRVQYNRTGTAETYQGDRSFLNILGLDIVDENGGAVEGGDEVVDLNPYVINRARGILIFPSLQPFNPLAESRFDELAEEFHVDIYNLNTSSTNDFVERSKFEMIVTSKSTKSTFDLGFYVLEGSEVVTLNGRTLDRDKDYVIDYFSGQLTLLSNEAKRSSSNINIKYERANLFQLDKKTILGGRLEYQLWDDAFIGLTALYLNKTTLDRRVRVGQEPFRNFVWDVNAAFKFKPRFVTNAIDALPLIETSDESEFDIEGEFAQVFPNPNTLNNSSTGDNNGVAYIDDFEASKRTTTLGIRYRTWTLASAPRQLPGSGTTNPTQAEESRAHLNWFNPFNQVPIKNIWPNRDVNSQTGQTTDVLGLEFWRDPGSDSLDSWAGIMRSTASFADQQKTKYVELWVKGNKGTINIDVGRISEDYYVTGTNFRGEPSLGNLNTEDRNSNGLLEDNEDTGIDGISNGQGDDDSDDWAAPSRANTADGWDYSRINGTEGNGNAQGARYPDTEDLDGDGQLNTFNDYFTYSFSLDPDDPDAQKYITGSTEAGWRQFRIPLTEPTGEFGTPDTTFQQVLNVRLWVSDIPVARTLEERTRIQIATFDFVGNEWEEEGYALVKPQPGETPMFINDESIFVLATYNTEENAVPIPGVDPYRSPPGVSGVRDRITNALSKEQSLVMHFEDLPAGAIAEAKKTLFQSLELVNYKRMRMFIYGSSISDPPIPVAGGIDTSNIRFYLRFGSNDQNYYEYTRDVYQGWSNEMDIDLEEMARVKFDEDKEVPLPDVPGGYYRAVGNPSLNTIRFFTIGVENKNNVPFSGEVWLDELRLSDVRRETATAMRMKTNMRFADLMRITAEWESVDADFHNVSQQFGEGSTLERQNYSGIFNFDKLLPPEWDLSVPIDARASFSRNIPKYLPRTDILTEYSNDTFGKKLKSLFGLRGLPKDLEDQVSTSETIGLGTTIKKRGKSKNWFLKYTIDEMSFDFDYSRQNRTSYEVKYNRSEQFKESYRYNIPFDKDNYIEPLAFTKTIPVLKEIYDTKLYYSPSSVNFSLSVSDATTEQLRRDSASTVKSTKNTGANRSISINYKLLQNLSMQYSRSHRSDADFDSLSRTELYKNIITKFNFGLDTDISQRFGADYKPSLFTWLSPDFSYDANFLYQLTNNYQYKQGVSRTTKRAGANFSPDKLMKVIYEPEPERGSSRTRGRPRRGRPQQTDDDKKQGEEQKEGEEEEEEGGVSLPNPLIGLYNAVSAFKNIKVDYTLDENVTNQFLSDIPSFGYQFGFTRDPGVPQDSALIQQGVNLVRPSFSETRGLRTSTSLNVTENVRVSLNHEYRENFTATNGGQTKQGGETMTFFALGTDPKKDFQGLDSDPRRFIPDWNVNVSGIEKYLFFKDFAQSITIDHGHSGKYDEKQRLSPDGSSFEPYQQTFSNNWQPLVGVNIRTKWGIGATIRMNSNTNHSYNASGGATRTESSGFTVSMNYSKSTGFKIPIPIWPFKGKTFKNEINFTLTFDASENSTFQRQAGNNKFQEQQKNTSWKLRPSATYRFNTRVQGSMFFETGATTNKISGEYSYSEFGINVNIAIRD